MIKISFILLGAYFLYYAGNIVYDLFLKKEKVLQTDIAEEFSLGDFAGTQDSPTLIGIEDVENLNTPTSFLRKEFQSAKKGVEESKPEIEDLRRRFEAEQDIDNEKEDELNTPIDSSEAEEQNSSVKEPEIWEIPIHKNEQSEQHKPDWKEILKLSETQVQMVANYEGQKVYHSVS